MNISLHRPHLGDFCNQHIHICHHMVQDFLNMNIGYFHSLPYNYNCSSLPFMPHLYFIINTTILLPIRIIYWIVCVHQILHNSPKIPCLPPSQYPKKHNCPTEIRSSDGGRRVAESQLVSRPLIEQLFYPTKHTFAFIPISTRFI